MTSMNSTRHWGRLTRRISAVFLAALMTATAVCACTPKTVIIPAHREIKALPDGRYSVSPGWLRERYRLERGLLDRVEELEKYPR